MEIILPEDFIILYNVQDLVNWLVRSVFEAVVVVDLPIDWKTSFNQTVMHRHLLLNCCCRCHSSEHVANNFVEIFFHCKCVEVAGKPVQEVYSLESWGYKNCQTV